MSVVGAEVLERDGGDTPSAAPLRDWNVSTRIGFRFCVAYFGLFCVLFAQILFAFTGPIGNHLPDTAVLWQMRAVEPITVWVGEHIFGVDAALRMNGSGDQAGIWMLILCILLVAIVITAGWSVLDRRRTDYATFGKWFVVFIRLCLGGQMLWYGFAKAIPNQMPYPALTTMLQPYGEQSMSEVLWNQVGAAPAYQVLLGIAEVLGGLLLFLPRTATVGAMLSLVSMAQVFVLNMTFDVPVKILSFHLLLLSLIVLAPQARRLANVLVLERSSEPASQPPLFHSGRANRIAAVVQVALGLWVSAGALEVASDSWHEYGYGAPKPPLYGIWNVTEFSIDGHPIPPLTTDRTRWQRVVFDTYGTSYQRMDDSLRPAVADVDTTGHTMTFTAPPTAPDAEPHRFATFTFEQPAPDRLMLRGELEGRPVTLTLQQQDLDDFPLRGSGFHWVQNEPSLG
ncbi:DoxX family protein [Nocardia sp. NPDC050710]|uniref:DoxX family protein n=1 Tax=Nocardia sp. NPDC050710 TaxID=3157220 RepID=UPI0033F7AB1A